MFNMKEGIREKKQAVLEAKAEGVAEGRAESNCDRAQMQDGASQTEIIEENGCDRPKTRASSTATVAVQTLCTVSPNAVSPNEEDEANHILGASVRIFYVAFTAFSHVSTRPTRLGSSSDRLSDRQF